MRYVLQGQSMFWLCSLPPKVYQAMLFGESPAWLTTFSGAFPIHFLTTKDVVWRIYRDTSLPVPFRSCLWSCFPWICPTHFWTTACLCSLQWKQILKVYNLLRKEILYFFLLNTSYSFSKFPLIVLLPNWCLTILLSSHAPYPPSSWLSQ